MENSYIITVKLELYFCIVPMESGETYTMGWAFLSCIFKISIPFFCVMSFKSTSSNEATSGRSVLHIDTFRELYFRPYLL